MFQKVSHDVVPIWNQTRLHHNQKSTPAWGKMEKAKEEASEEGAKPKVGRKGDCGVK